MASWNVISLRRRPIHMTIHWAPIYNRLFELIDRKGESYFSGGRFIGKVREVDPYFPSYKQYMDERRATAKSTSRRDYFYDILLQFDEAARMRVISSILNEVEHCDPNLAAEIRSLIGGAGTAPRAVVHPVVWSAARLNVYLAEMDAAIGTGQYERAINLAYTCLEGFYTAFIREKDSILYAALDKTFFFDPLDTVCCPPITGTFWNV
jgi:hypothetical protein